MNILCWIIMPYHFVLLLKFPQLWWFGALSVGSCALSTNLLQYVHMCGFGFLFYLVLWALLYFLALQDASGSSQVLTSRFPEPVISWSPASLLENGIRNQDLGIRCAHCYRGVVSLGQFQLMMQRNIGVYAVNTANYKCSLDVTIRIYIKINMSSYWCLQHSSP